jgi:hypothetical protein
VGRLVSGQASTRADAGPTVFISIASYRDPELIPTIADCLAKARRPENLRFGICWQHGPEEELPLSLKDERFRVVDVDSRRSRGVCWARAQIMKLWAGEEWYLQLDSHHRFVKDWDVKLLNQAALTGSNRPIITTYGAPYSPGAPDGDEGQPLQIEFFRFTQDGIPMFRPGQLPSRREQARPLRARFASAHLLFAQGSLVERVPYDPTLYFEGEEIMLGVRAYTHGYDLFHPSELIVWHEYTRQYRRKHWDDHIGGEIKQPTWYERDALSRDKICRFLTRPWKGRFGCGSARTLAEYEAFAGISFRHQRIQDYTRLGLEPPNPRANPDWAVRAREYRLKLVLDKGGLQDAALRDARFWYLGFHDSSGTEIYRKDVEEAELREVLASDAPTVGLERNFTTASEPASWTVLPYSNSEGWLEKITGFIPGEGIHLDAIGSGIDDGAVSEVLAPQDSDQCGLPAMTHGLADRDNDVQAPELAIWYPRTAPGVTWTEAKDGFVGNGEADAPPLRLVVNSTGALLLELANGRYSVAEIVDVVGNAYRLASPPADEIVGFYVKAAEHGLIQPAAG